MGVAHDQRRHSSKSENGISYVALWNPPAGLSHAQLFFYLIGMAIVVRSFVSLYEVPSAALVAELTTDYNQLDKLF